IYDRIDSAWMLNGDPYLLSHGWRPETGFIPHRWAQYSEHSLLYLLAIAAKQPIPPAAWYAWERPLNEYGPYKFVGRAPMLIHQYSHAWIDFRAMRDRSGIDYFQNSVDAARAHRQFCIDLAPEFPSYSENLWGIAASDSEHGYVDWGGPPRHKLVDGTIVPWAAAGSLMLTPDTAIPALRTMRERFGDAVYKRYGFVDAFKPGGWIASDVIGIDAGITLLSAENLRSGNVWRWFMRNAEARRAFELAGLAPEPTFDTASNRPPRPSH
ncbi:MAG: Tat pathway signal protein, partial [Rhodospirillales bacterium]|nr:Tat pathway signal protein [Rhodospirillales bacterium]